MFVWTLGVVLASVVIRIFADSIDTDLTLRTLHNFPVAVAARRVVNALIADASLTVTAIKILVAFGFRYNPGER